MQAAAEGKDGQAQEEEAEALPTHQAPPAAGVYHLVSSGVWRQAICPLDHRRH